MGTVYASDAFAEYAKTHVGYADTKLAEHDVDGCGLCRCGRAHPCDERRHWQQMRDHYLACLDSLAPVPPLVRPYVGADERPRSRR